MCNRDTEFNILEYELLHVYVMRNTENMNPKLVKLYQRFHGKGKS
jgi:hypothetical protein